MTKTIFSGAARFALGALVATSALVGPRPAAAGDVPDAPAGSAFFQVPGSYFTAQTNRTIGVTSDGKIAVTATGAVTSFDPVTGAVRDTKPLSDPIGLTDVLVAEQGGKPRVLLVGNAAVTIFSLGPSGRLKLKKRRVLTTSGSSFDGTPVMSRTIPVAYTVIDASIGENQIVAFSTKNGKILGRYPTSFLNPHLGFLESDARRLVFYLGANDETLEVVDVTDPTAMRAVASIPVPRNDPVSGYYFVDFVFSADGRYVFFGDGSVRFTAVDVESMRVVGSLDVSFASGRSLVVETPGARTIVLEKNAPPTGGPGSLLAVDATDPTAMRVVSEVVFDDHFASNTTSLAASTSGDRVVVASTGAIGAFSLPGLTPIWRHPLADPLEFAVSAVRTPGGDRVLAAWMNGDAASVPLAP